jgi:hypothetical protein
MNFYNFFQDSQIDALLSVAHSQKNQKNSMSHLQVKGKFQSAHQTLVKIDEFWFEKLKKQIFRFSKTS